MTVLTKLKYPITTKIMSQLINTHPGELLSEDFLKPMNLSAYRLAQETHMPAQRISDLINGKRAITPDTDARLVAFFGLTQGYWMCAQLSHDIRASRARAMKIAQQIKPYQPVVEELTIKRFSKALKSKAKKSIRRGERVPQYA